MNNLQLIYFCNIENLNCYKNIISHLEYISSYSNNKINIIFVSDSVEKLEHFSYMVNLVLRKGKGIGFKVRNIPYSIYLIKNNHIVCDKYFLKKIKSTSNKEKNKETIYLCIDSNFIENNSIFDLYLTKINLVIDKFNNNKIHILTHFSLDETKIPIFFISKKYIDNTLHYDDLFLNPNIYKLEYNKEHINDISIYSYFNDKYNIEFYETDFENSTTSTELINITTNLNFAPISDINHIDEFILIIDFQKLGGGTTFFLQTIINKYKFTNTFIILRNVKNRIQISINDEYKLDELFTYDEILFFIQNKLDKILKIFVNHTLHHEDFFIEKLFDYKKEITYITHDYFLLFKNPQLIYEDIEEEINLKSNIYINRFDKIITQNINNLYIFDKYLTEKKNIIITELPDFKKSKKIYKKNNENIVIGFVGLISDIKGSQFLISLNNYIRHNNLNMKIIIFGCLHNNKYNIMSEKYENIEDFNNLLIKYQPNLLIDASIWPETYSYTLTIMMTTKLPILMLKKNFNSVIHNRLKNYNNFYIIENIENCVDIILKVKQDFFYTIDSTIYYNKFWDDYFTRKDKTSINNINEFNSIISNLDKNTNDSIHKFIEPYAIYFPQFHRIPENDILFYEGYTDYINLTKMINENKVKSNILTPLKGVLDDYDIVLNKDLIKKQIQLAKSFGIKGFAFYHYWFDNNEYYKENHNIMETFTKNIIEIDDDNFSYFLIWANDKWCNKLYNNYNYNETVIEKHFDNLLKYFNDKKYKKVDNKPVFGILHFNIWSIQQFDKYISFLNNKCIENSFNGIYITVITQPDLYVPKCCHAVYVNVPSWKNACMFGKLYTENNITYVDYKYYMRDFESELLDKISENKDIILNIFPNFDNYVRNYCKITMRNHSYIDSTPENFEKYFIKILNLAKKYKNNSKILLINSWNEWGENMAIEPSNEYKYKYLEIIYENLKKNIN